MALIQRLLKELHHSMLLDQGPSVVLRLLGLLRQAVAAAQRREGADDAEDGLEKLSTACALKNNSF